MTSFHGPALDPPGSTTCGNCNNLMTSDARFCDQCGNTPPGTPDPAVRHPGQSRACPMCAAPNFPDANFCQSCGNQVYGGVPGEQAAPVSDPHPQTATAVSSSGRYPMLDSSPAGRAAFLADASRGLTPFAAPEPDLFTKISQAEQAVARAEDDHAAARAAVEDAAARCAPGSLDGVDDSGRRRSRWIELADLTPAERHAGAVWAQARTGADEAASALDTAQMRLSRLLAEYEELQRPDLGLRPGPGLNDDGPFGAR